MESSGQQETCHTQTEQTGAHLGNGTIVDLLLETKTTKKEGHTQDEEQVCQDGTQQRSLNDANLILDKSNNENDQLDGVTKGDVDQSSDRVTQAGGHALSGVTEESGQGDNGHGVHREDDGRVQADCPDDDTDRHEDQQDVDPAMAEGILGVVVEPAAAIAHANEQAWFGVVFLGGTWRRAGALDCIVHLYILGGGRGFSDRVGL